MTEATLLPVSKHFLDRSINAGTTRLVIMQHALRDSVEFVSLALAAGYTVGTFLAKPNSLEQDAVTSLKAMGINVVCESYETIENTNLMDAILEDEVRAAKLESRRLCIVDVGGYFCEPLMRCDKSVSDGITGVVEVTTFGHNRYVGSASNLPVPIVSIARSPIKAVEAANVGETVVQATDDILREIGLAMVDKSFGVIGFGMIGRRIAISLKNRGLKVAIGDISMSAQLAAKLDNLECLEIGDLLNKVDIVFSATARQSIPVKLVKKAKTGIMLVSGGSKANEFDVQGIKDHSSHHEDLSDNLRKYTMTWGKTCVLANEGKAVNFLKGGSPEEVMDPVFAEQAECINHLCTSNLPLKQVSELPAVKRDVIARIWIDAQQSDTINLFT